MRTGHRPRPESKKPPVETFNDNSPVKSEKRRIKQQTYTPWEFPRDDAQKPEPSPR